MSFRKVLLPLVSRSTLVAALLLLNSCRSPEPVWNDDGRTMTDLRVLRHRNRPSVKLDRGVKLYADSINFTDKRRRTGDAVGRVFLDVGPSARYKWMIEHGYAARATFDRRASVVMLAGKPMLEREHMTMIATEDYTTMHVQWFGRMAHVHVKGPTRTDFAKSHPIPPDALPPPHTTLPPAPPAKSRVGLALGKK